MRDFRQNLQDLWRTAARTQPASGGRVILFISAHKGEGASSAACSFALVAASRATRTAWLVDLDIRKNPQYTAFAQGIVKDAGRPGHALDASLGTEQIYTVGGHEKDLSYGKLLNAHQIEGQRLLVTRFRGDRLAAGEKVRLRPAPGWWSALRSAADWVVIDAPSLDRTRAGLAVAPLADGVVLVVRADATPAHDVAALRQDVEAAGGRVIGIVLNRIGDDALLLDRFGSRG